ncbi:MAG: hypothetical protein EBZ49_02935 [Proteobacteria bacterium]|nr:hypothetical protein [Pseudomonadota bacterium]
MFSISLSDLGLRSEGLYEINIVCEDRINPNCNELNRTARLAVISTPESLAVSVGYPEQSISRYSFVSDAGLQGSVYTGVEASDHSFSSHFAEIRAEFLNEEGKVKVTGIIRDARFSKDITFAGEQTLATQNLKSFDPNTVNFSLADVIEGRFLARGEARQWLINIRKKLSSGGAPSYYAESIDLGSPDEKLFSSGERVHLHSIQSSDDTLELLAPLSKKGSFLKWVLWASPEGTSDCPTLQGFFFSSQGIFSRLTLKKLGPDQK